MNKRIRTLIVEDSPSLSALCASYLDPARFDIAEVTTLREARAALNAESPDLVLLDVELPDGNGLRLIDEFPPQLTGSQVIVMTAHGSSEMAIDAIGRGAFDYLQKPFDADRLRTTVSNALSHHQLDSQVRDLTRTSFCDFIGESMAMQSVYKIIESVAPSDATAFITGQSGTGKELTASAIHQLSSRSSKQFHAINCGAIPKELMESALFGHVKGAFTGAVNARDGAAAIADGGTLFLDEICEMDLELQTKMLRFIQTGEYQRVGSDKIERADVRFVCATNRDPLGEVRAGNFREDLYYRLHVVPIKLPPLCDRGSDVLAIAEHFLTHFTQAEGKSFVAFTSSAKDALKRHCWPGNVRELQNVIHNAVVLNNDMHVDAHMLTVPLGSDSLTPNINSSLPKQTSAISHSASGTEILPLWLTEKLAIEQAIKHCGGNVTEAAALLEVSPSTIYRKRQTWDSAQEKRSA